MPTPKRNLLLAGAVLLPLMILLMTAPDAFAQTTLQNPLGESDLRVIIGRLIRALLGISGAVALLMFVWGGYQWIISAGNEDRIKKGKQTLIWTTIGLVIIFTAYTLVGTLITALTSGAI